MPPYSRKRIAGIVVSLVLALIAAKFAFDAFQRERQLRQWAGAQPVRVEVDLSRAGVIEMPLLHDSPAAHGTSLYLLIDAEPSVHPAALLEGLQGTAEVISGDGQGLCSTELPNMLLLDMALQDSVEEDGIAIATLGGFEVGKYTLRLEVTEPAPQLAGIPQVLVARYRLCGCEAMPIFISGVAALFAGVPALVIGTVTLVSIRRGGWRVSLL